MKILSKQIEQLNDLELMQVWNKVCELYDFHDDYIYENDEEFFEMMGLSAYEVLQRAHFGNYSWHHKYVKLDGYANFESGDYVDQMIDDTQIVDCVEQYPEEFTEWFELETETEEE